MVAGWRCLKLIKLEYDVVTGELKEIVVDYPNVETEPHPQEPSESERIGALEQALLEIVLGSAF